MSVNKDEVFSFLDGLRDSRNMANMSNVVKHMEVAFNIDKQTARSYLEDWMRSRKNGKK